MSFGHQYALSRRGFCICCAVASGFVATRGWLDPSRAYAEAQNLVDLIRDQAAKTPIKVHKLRGGVSILEGSGGNVAVLTGVDGKVFIDAGITASRKRILEAANGLSRDPITHLVNTHRAELAAYRDMLVAIHDNVAKLKRQGRSLEETIAANPTAAYDAKWGQFLITPAFFTRLVYEGA